MEKEIKQTFVRRIVESNRTELIVIMYELADYYLKEAREAGKDERWDDFKRELTNGERVVARLSQDLDFKYPISGELFSLYQFCQVELAKARALRQAERINGVSTVLNNLAVAMKELAKKDHSPALIQNSQQVTAGMTYQKGSLTETFQEEGQRGFLV